MTDEEIVGSRDYAIVYFEQLNCDSSTEDGQTVYSFKGSGIVWGNLYWQQCSRPKKRR